MDKEQRLQKKREFISLFKKFMGDHNRRPTSEEIKNNEMFEEYYYKSVIQNIGRLKTIENRIKKGIY